jgi:hypothetical protein
VLSPHTTVPRTLLCLLACWPLLASAQRETTCDEAPSPHILVDTGHLWRPPFGTDRVGAPLVVHVELVAVQALQRDYFVAAIVNGHMVERHAVELQKDKSSFFATAQLRTVPESVVLLGRCRADGKEEELIRQSVKFPDIEADARAQPEQPINPVDLGAILPPHDWLLIAERQYALLKVAAISRRKDQPNVRLRVWFDDETPVEVALPLRRNQRVLKEVRIPVPLTNQSATTLNVRLVGGERELWKKEIHTMVVAKPPKVPFFGAIETKLRYDAPVLVSDPATGAALPPIPYNSAWDSKLNDVVVFLPNGSRFVFWRGSSYAPFWAGKMNTGLTYEWVELAPWNYPGSVDCMEPLQDKELRYGRVRIMESTASRVHVRWTYQSPDLFYKVWGDAAIEDYYFYPDGFGTRVVTLTAAPDADYELTEFLVLEPQGAPPLEVLPTHMIDLLFLNGQEKHLTYPSPFPKRDNPVFKDSAGAWSNSDKLPLLFRIYYGNDDSAAVYFSPNDVPENLFVFEPIKDRGETVTRSWWGSNWPLNRGRKTVFEINNDIDSGPSVSSLMPWGVWSWGNRPTPLLSGTTEMVDALGRSKKMTTQRWAWLIAETNASNETLIDWAKSFSQPPSMEVAGGRIDFPSYSQERRALRLIVDSANVDINLKPSVRTVNPVIELDQAPQGNLQVYLDGKKLPPQSYAWDGATLWMNTTIEVSGVDISLRFDPN